MSYSPGNAGQLDPTIIMGFARNWHEDDPEIQTRFLIYISAWWESMQFVNPTATRPRPQTDGSILFETNEPSRRWRYDVQLGSIHVVG